MPFKVFAPNEYLTSADVNNYLMEQVVIRCTSGTRPGSPVDGMPIYETDTKMVRVYNGTAWRRFAFDAETYAPVHATDATTIGGITSTSWAQGTPVVSIVFVAPPSGRVFITVSGSIAQTANGNETRLSYELLTGAVVGSGTTVAGPSTLRGIMCGRAVNSGAAAVLSASYRRPVSGLTPGASYNLRTMHSVSGGTGTVENRELVMEPVL